MSASDKEIVRKVGSGKKINITKRWSVLLTWYSDTLISTTYSHDEFPVCEAVHTGHLSFEWLYNNNGSRSLPLYQYQELLNLKTNRNFVCFPSKKRNKIFKNRRSMHHCFSHTTWTRLRQITRRERRIHGNQTDVTAKHWPKLAFVAFGGYAACERAGCKIPQAIHSLHHFTNTVFHLERRPSPTVFFNYSRTPIIRTN